MAHKIVYVGFAYPHHKGTHAGYHHISDYGIYDKIIDIQKEYDFNTVLYSNRYITPVYSRLHKLVGSAYLLAIIRCILYALMHRDVTFHFIYPENVRAFCILFAFLSRNQKVVFTLHQPITFYENKIWTNWLTHVDKIILMSEDDVEAVKRITKKDNVKFIPHGIDTTYYCPDVSNTKERRILMVGNWLRNFEFANEVFCKMLNDDKDLHVDVITNKKNHDKFNPHERLHLLTNITDDELRDLYRKCSIMFLPLNAYTANNALLEAASSGCRIVIATNNINESYLTESQIKILPLNLSAVIANLTTLLDEDIDNVKINDVRQYIVDNFSWSTIAKKVKAYILS